MIRKENETYSIEKKPLPIAIWSAPLGETIQLNVLVGAGPINIQAALVYLQILQIVWISVCCSTLWSSTLWPSAFASDNSLNYYFISL